MPALARVEATVPFVDVVGVVWFADVMTFSPFSVTTTVMPVPLLAVFPDMVTLQLALHVKYTFIST